MSRPLKSTIHSEFRDRVTLVVRAPRGDAPRARLMQDLVEELRARHAIGSYLDWVVDAMVEKFAREQALQSAGAGAAMALVAQPLATATQRVPAADIEDRAEPVRREQPADRVEVMPQHAPEAREIRAGSNAPTAPRIPAGLRVM